MGGLTCRALVEYMDDHNVHTLISMAGPQMGVYGETFLDFMKKYPSLEKLTFANAYAILYTWLAQKTLSVANMWNDPTKHGDFLSGNRFLPFYNGLTDDSGNAKRKANFIRLQKAVFLTGIPQPQPGSEYDGGIEPFQSGVFGFYKDGSQTEFVEMKEQQVYTEDTFGLKTLDVAGKLLTSAVPNVGHGDWVHDDEVVKKYVLPHLV